MNEAGQWLSRNGVDRALKGQYVDLRPWVDQIKGTEGFKWMVIRAAVRLIEKRGGHAISPPAEE